MSVEIVAIQGFFSFLIVLLFIKVIMWIAEGSQTHQQRKKLVDLYIMAKLKKLAKTEDIDLVKEEKEFEKKVSRRLDLDDQIENDLVKDLEEKADKEKKKE